MFAAVIEVSGMYRECNLFKGESLEDIINQFNRIQDICCLCMAAYRMGTKEDIMEAEKTEEFISKWRRSELTVDDLKNLIMDFSIGTVRCYDVMEGDDSFEILKAKYPQATLK